MDALKQTVDALNAGQSGLDLKPLLFQYGSQSDIYRIAVQAQGMLLSNSIQQGHPNEQMEKLRSYVNKQCGQGSASATVPPGNDLGTSAPTSTADFPWVEPPTVTETRHLGATDYARYPSSSDCEAGAASVSTLKSAADESDTAFASDQKGNSDAEITMMAYARKYVKALRQMGYPRPEDAVNSHWADLCSTLSNSDPGQ
ncbi:hypothetical protein [Streptomyces sp. NPDC049915]|uniref:hypothetical protein n=1 Tax=Streptomyces sp. NPDC049915 TaxID=3155510 RepID=UPI003421852A